MYIIAALLLFAVSASNAQNINQLNRAYAILGLEDDEHNERSARLLHGVLIKTPRYQLTEYHEPAVRALVERIIKDANDALAVIMHAAAAPSLPAVSPLDAAYVAAVNTFLDRVGAYTRVIALGQDEQAIKAAAQTLQTFMASDDYKHKVRQFLPQEPIFDFTLLKSAQPMIKESSASSALSLSQLFDRLYLLQEQAQHLRAALPSI